MELTDPLTSLPGIGIKSAEKYEKLGLKTVGDLLVYYPFRYEDLKAKEVLDLLDGEKAVIVGEVATPAHVQYYGYKRNRLSFKLRQGELVVGVFFFNQPYLVDKISLGEQLAIWGKWDQKKATLTGMKILAQKQEDMQPVYHVAQGITQAAIVKLVTAAFQAGYHRLLEENLPEILRTKYRLLDRQETVLAMHFPTDNRQYKQALRRAKFEELFYYQMRLQMLRLEGKQDSAGLEIVYQKHLLEARQNALPFKLTDAQQSCLEDILKDMRLPTAMNRLLQGDVGSGKTVVASLAMYAAVTAGFQAAMMVPTEILAEQHYTSLTELFPDLSLALLTGSMKVSEKRTALKAIADGEVDLIVGTHALIQEGVTYYRLGLVITDEQHRFGVEQRRAFREKGSRPDVLMMSATPIPRTLAITAYGEMDVSVIDQLPSGRKPIVTRWVKHEQFQQVLTWLKSELQKGVQCYVISPLIEASMVLDLKNAIALADDLQRFFGEGISLALLHGKMKSQEKDEVMQAFKDREIDILVSTTVIEVGVNVPNATIMIIMDADRFGLSQLHQLRGRVGRGQQQSYAILVANPKTESGKKRMTLMTKTTNGFVLAEEDLKMRGSGEIFGTRQSGIPEFQVVDLVEDYPILEEARRITTEIVQDSNWAENPDWKVISTHLDKPSWTD